MRISRTGIWTSTSLEPALIRLSAADEMQEFWEATKALLHLALPIHFCCLCFRPFIVMPATVFREHTPFASDAEFRRFRELCPFSAYVEHHPGIRVIRLTDIIDNSKLLKTEFFRLFMQPCADRYQAYLVLWESSLFQGLVGLHRTAQQRDFTDTEILLFARTIVSAFRERRKTCAKLASRKGQKNVPGDPSEPAPDRDDYSGLGPQGYLSEPGSRRTRGLMESRTAGRPELGTVPAFRTTVRDLETCRNLKNTWDHGESDDAPPRVDNRLVIEHQHLAGLRASVNVLQMDAAPLSRPMFLVTLERRDSSPSDSGEHLNQLATWAQLTRSEQQVAWLAGQGQRNAEIAQSLKKSTMTVKKQLQSIYHKLDVTGRGRLIALLRPTDYFDSGKQQLIGRGLAENGRFKEAGWFG
jgi:DNA-binding CsgD family transcriptional regulator